MNDVEINREHLSWADCRVSAYGAHISLSRIGRTELVDAMRQHLGANVDLLDQLKMVQRQLGHPGFAVMKQPFDAIAELTTRTIEYLCARIKDFGGMPERALLASLRAPTQHSREIPFADALTNIHSRVQDLASFARQIQPVTQRASRYGDYATAALVTEMLSHSEAIIQAIKLNIPSRRTHYLGVPGSSPVQSQLLIHGLPASRIHQQAGRS
jgi:DNA-binding ferritin-like protein